MKSLLEDLLPIFPPGDGQDTGSLSPGGGDWLEVSKHVKSFSKNTEGTQLSTLQRAHAPDKRESEVVLYSLDVRLSYLRRLQIQTFVHIRRKLPHLGSLNIGEVRPHTRAGCSGEMETGKPDAIIILGTSLQI